MTEETRDLRDLMSVYNPTSATLPMLIGALADSNRWRGGIIGLVIDRIACVGYYWGLNYDHPWKPEAKRPWWLIPAVLAELLLTAGIAISFRRKEQ